ncbi:MAG: BrnT family toxin [Pseudomonadales bacterium]|nr:BrnT family toxin [Pseudomonadales bacterium]
MFLFDDDTNWHWDAVKNDLNRQKQGFGFETAELVFDDPLSWTQRDPYPREMRWQTIGMINNMFVVVVHTSPEVDPVSGEMTGRIISARQATRKERTQYEQESY